MKNQAYQVCYQFGIFYGMSSIIVSKLIFSLPAPTSHRVMTPLVLFICLLQN